MSGLGLLIVVLLGWSMIGSRKAGAYDFNSSHWTHTRRDTSLGRVRRGPRRPYTRGR